MFNRKGIIISCIIALTFSMMMPFHLSAATISQSNIKGVNYSIINVSPIEGTSTTVSGNVVQRALFTHRFEVVLDKEYVGYITGSLDGNYMSADSSGNSTTYHSYSGSRSFYIHGQSFVYYMQTQEYILINQQNSYSASYSASFTYAGSNVISDDFEGDILTWLQDIDNTLASIERSVYDGSTDSVLSVSLDIYDVLVDLYDSFEDRIANIQNSLGAISESTNMLNQLRQYHIDIYSLNLVIGCFQRFRTLESLNDIYYSQYNDIFLSYLDYPIFIIPNGYNEDYIFDLWALKGETYMFILGTNCGVGNILSTNFPISKSGSGNIVIQNTTNLFGSFIPGYENPAAFTFSKITFTVTNNMTCRLSIHNNTGYDLLFCPILYNRISGINFSLDMAILYNLPNPLLDYLNILSYGNTDSQNASSDLEYDKQQMDTQFNNLFTVEDGYNTDLNNQLNNIDFTNPLTNNNSMFGSGNFVISVFNALIQDNPISLLIVIVCILLVARRLFG